MSSFAAFLGDVQGVRNLPGYIDLKKRSYPYKGIKTTKVRGIAERRTPSQILNSFIKKNKFDLSKFDQLIGELKGYKKNIKITYCMDKYRKKVNSYLDCSPGGNLNKKIEQKLDKKWKKNKFNLAISYAIENLEQAKDIAVNLDLKEINHESSQHFLELFFSSHEIYQGIRAEDEQQGWRSFVFNVVLKAIDLFQKNIIRSDRPEATNLLVPDYMSSSTKNYFMSPDQIDSFQENGGDISLLDPPSNGMWRKPVKSISEFDTSNYDLQGLKQLENILPKKTAKEVLNPKSQLRVIYKPHIIKGGQTPKFNVYLDETKFKLKFITDAAGFTPQKAFWNRGMKFLWGSEVNTEPVVNTLAAALGFTVDPTYFQNSIRVYFEDHVYENGEFEKYLANLIQNLEERYVIMRHLKSALKMVKVDSEGKKYIEMKSVTLEAKSNRKSDMNIGFYVRDGLGKSLKREHRAFYNFLAWVGDFDTKDDNDKTKIVPYIDEAGKTKYKVMLSASDMGGSLGTGFPNFYNYKLIKSVSRGEKTKKLKEIRYNYFRIFPYNISKAVTFNDVKWITRRIAQLSVHQIEQAFVYSGYPLPVAKYYAKLMIKRRNQLVRVFEMEGEQFIDDGGKPFRIEMLPEWDASKSEYASLFKNGVLADDDNTTFNPELENWPRNWGVGYQRIKPGTKQDQILQSVKQNITDTLVNSLHASIYNAQLGTKGLRIFNVRLFDTDNPLRGVCGEDCFVEAMDIGVKNFIPMRYLIQNPDTSAKHPYLLVDLFRFGFFLGENGKLIQKALGFEIPSGFNLSVGSQFFKSFEFIKVKPVSSLNDYYKNKWDMLKLPKYSLKKMRSQLIEQLEENESLIVSSYVGLRSQLKVRPRWVPFVSAEVAFRRFNLGRSTILKGAEGKVYANWAKGKYYDSMINLNAFDWGARIPLVSIQSKSTYIDQDTYMFDLNNLEQKDLLKKNMTLRKPRSLDKKHLLIERTKYHKERKSLFSFFKLFGKRKYKRKIINRFNNHENPKQNMVNKIYEIEHQKLKMIDIVEAGESYKSTVFMNKKKEITMGVSLSAIHPAMRKSDFRKVLRTYKSVLPPDLFPFDFKYMKTLLGKTTMDISIQFSPNGLKKFFDPKKKKYEMCLNYMKFKQSPSVILSCEFIRSDKTINPALTKGYRQKFEKFWKRYAKARKNFNYFNNKNFTRRQFKRLKRLARFMLDRKFKLEVVHFLIKTIGESNFKREVHFQSARYPFPGDIDILQESNFEKGKLDSISYFDEVQTKITQLNEAASRYFYDRVRPFFREEGFLFNVPK
ncbi:hypothetical protein N9N67_07610 [Bacteriovoracaceae bacterium]|nr:hypothetical protein [Bacteriovoracaceae bacterium]